MKEFIEVLKKNAHLKSLIIVVSGIILYSIIKLFIHFLIKNGKSSYEIKRRNTIVKLLENVFKYIIIIVVVFNILEAYGVDTKSLIAGIGVAGVVLGLALQDFIKDLISGLSIMLDNYYVIGDIVEYEGFTGEVVEFGLKSTKLESFDGKVLSIANRNIDKIVNLSQKSANIMIKVPTAYEEKEEKVSKVLNAAIKEIVEKTEATDQSAYMGVDDFDKSSVNYLIKIHCPKEQRFKVRRAALDIIKKAYDKNNIKIPYTQVEVHNAK